MSARRRRRHALDGLAVATAVLLVGGCAASLPEQPATTTPAAERRNAVEWVFEVRESAAPARLPADPDDLVILNTVASVITRDLKLPLPETVRAVAYSNTPTFAEALVRRGIAPDRAHDSVGRAVAMAVGGDVLFRADILAHAATATKMGLFAHELAHVAQGRLVGRRDVAIWLLEGHADWVQRRVVDLLSHGTYTVEREAVRFRVARAKVPREQFPPLSALEAPEAWRQAVRDLGWAPTYGQAFLAVDRLVEQHTEARLHAFLRMPPGPLRARFDDERLRWASTFAQTYERFLLEFRAYLLALP